MTIFDEEQIQKERDLNSLLYANEVKSVLGEDLLFLLRGIFVERHCFNLRNRLAHGLLGKSYFNENQAYLAPFTWALTMYLCLEVRQTFFKNLGSSSGESSG